MVLGDGNPIVIVDDEELDVRILQKSLKRQQVENPTLSFSSGKEFLAYLEELEKGKHDKPAVVLLDINMPGFSGFDILIKVKQTDGLRSELSYFICSNSDNPKDIKKAEELGADGFCSKANIFKQPQELLRYIDRKISGT